MGLAIGDEHVELAATVRRWVEARDVVGVARAALDAATTRCPTCGPSWPSSAGWAWPSPRPTAVRATACPSWWWCSRSWAAAACPGRSCPRWWPPRPSTAGAAIPRWPGRLVDGSAPAGLALRRRTCALDGGPGVGHGAARCGTAARRRAGSWCRSTEAGPARSTVWCVVDGPTSRCASCPASTAPAAWPRSRLDGVALAPSRRLAAGGGRCERLATLLAGAEALGVADWCVDHRRRPTPPSGCSSAGPSVSSRRSSIGAPTCWWRWRWPGPPCGTRPAPSTRRRPDAARLAPRGAERWPPRSAARGRLPVRQGLRPGAGRHRLHVGARRPPLPEAGHGHAPPAGPAGGLARPGWPGPRPRASAGRWPSSCHPGPPSRRGRRGPRRGAGLRGRAAAATTSPQWRAMLADPGYLTPALAAAVGPGRHARSSSWSSTRSWPRPTSAAPHLAVAGWALPTIIAHGSRRAAGPLREPDAAGRAGLVPDVLRARGRQRPGLAQHPGHPGRRAAGRSPARRCGPPWPREADLAICLARTDPDAPRHEGIGCFLLDMTTPGLDIRPLRELTGMAMFNEVFLTDVFVPDDCLVGSPTGGWAYARTTLANERVSMSSGSSFGPGLAGLFALAPASATAVGGRLGRPAGGRPAGRAGGRRPRHRRARHAHDAAGPGRRAARARRPACASWPG